jgi:hypothetical protein
LNKGDLVGKAKKIASAKPVARKHKNSGVDSKAGIGNGSSVSASSDTVVLDRRALDDRRRSKERRKADAPVVVERRSIERRQKVSRRRQIDPTTCERNYSVEEIEFMTALEGYKRTSGRMFPTCSEILEVLRGLGYQKAAPETPVASSDSAAMFAPSDPVSDSVSDLFASEMSVLESVN